MIETFKLLSLLFMLSFIVGFVALYIYLKIESRKSIFTFEDFKKDVEEKKVEREHIVRQFRDKEK